MLYLDFQRPVLSLFLYAMKPGFAERDALRYIPDVGDRICS